MIADADIDGVITDAEQAIDELEIDLARAHVINSLFENTDVKRPTLGRFELGERLGTGGMGVVYRAFDPQLSREVAVKLVRVHSDDRRAETLAEAQSLARITHPNVVAIHDVRLHADQVVLVMELVRGETLRSFALAEGRTTEEIVRAYRQAAQGLAAVHRADLIHRDFKPDNAVIGSDGRVRVIDFGLAHDQLTESTSRAGTPRYMAPEQTKGESISAAADQFALCASLEEALERLAAPIPSWLASIVARGQSPDPSDRFPSLDELAEHLSHDPRAVRRRRTYAVIAVAAAAGTFAIGATQFGDAGDAESCQGAETMLERVWSSDARAAALEIVRQSGPYGESLAPRLERAIAVFVNDWTSVHRKSCKAHDRRERSPQMFDLQSVCLEKQKGSFAASGALAAEANTETLPSLAKVFSSLPSPTECDDLEALTRAPAPPADIADEVAGIGRDLEPLKVALAAGQYQAVADKSRALAERAERSGFAPVQANVELIRGQSYLKMQNFKSSLEPLAKAQRMALIAGLDEIAIEAWARKAWARGMLNDAAALAEKEVIEALTERIGRLTFASGLFYNNIGSIEIARGNIDRAREALTTANEIARSVSGSGTVELANTSVNLALVTVDEAERDRLATESVDVLTAQVGADHPDTLAAAVMRANLASNANTTLALLRETCETLAALHPSLQFQIAQCFYKLGWFLEQVGLRAAAATAMSRADDEKSADFATAGGIAAVFSGRASDGIAVLTPLYANVPLTQQAWWQRLTTAELEVALGIAYGHLANGAKEHRKKARVFFVRAHERLDSIARPLPVVERLTKLITER